MNINFIIFNNNINYNNYHPKIENCQLKINQVNQINKKQTNFLLLHKQKNNQINTQMQKEKNEIIQLLVSKHEILNLFKLVQNIIRKQQQKDNKNIDIIVKDYLLFHYSQQQEISYFNQIINSEYLNKLLRNTFVSCKFIQLQNLILHNLQIDNLEFFEFMDAPLLESISLQSNRIYNCKALQKTNLQYVNAFSFRNNPINSLSLQRSFINSKQICLQLDNEGKTPIIMQDLSGLVKFRSKLIQALMIRGQDRIRQTILLKTIKKRFTIKAQPYKHGKNIFIIQKNY